MRELTVTEKDCAQQLIKYLSKYMEEAPKSFFYKEKHCAEPEKGGRQ